MEMKAKLDLFLVLLKKREIMKVIRNVHGQHECSSLLCWILKNEMKNKICANKSLTKKEYSRINGIFIWFLSVFRNVLLCSKEKKSDQTMTVMDNKQQTDKRVK